MATYSETDFNSSHYNEARPSYPHEFYQALMEYHKSSTDLAVDIGCGTGFVAFKLQEFFKNVIGTDISSTMINQCNNDPRTDGKSIQFLVGAAEKSPPQIRENSVDLVTGAECCHWVDIQAFYKETWSILKPGGTMAYWFYKEPIFINSPKANEVYDLFCYGDEYMGPCWEQPGKNNLRKFLKDVEMPSKLFEDIVIKEYDPLVKNSVPTSLHIKKSIHLQQFREYLTSWSAYHTWKKRNPDKVDIVDEFIKGLQVALGEDLEEKHEIEFATIYTFARKK